jgi:hypothetical protein
VPVGAIVEEAAAVTLTVRFSVVEVTPQVAVLVLRFVEVMFCPLPVPALMGVTVLHFVARL